MGSIVLSLKKQKSTMYLLCVYSVHMCSYVNKKGNVLNKLNLTNILCLIYFFYKLE